MNSVWNVAEKTRRLAAIMHTAPIMIADIHGPNPTLIEKLLVKRGQYNRNKDGSSILDAVEKYYCKEAALICLS